MSSSQNGTMTVEYSIQELPYAGLSSAWYHFSGDALHRNIDYHPLITLEWKGISLSSTINCMKVSSHLETLWCFRHSFSYGRLPWKILESKYFNECDCFNTSSNLSNDWVKNSIWFCISLLSFSMDRATCFASSTITLVAPQCINWKVVAK